MFLNLISKIIYSLKLYEAEYCLDNVQQQEIDCLALDLVGLFFKKSNFLFYKVT